MKNFETTHLIGWGLALLAVLCLRAWLRSRQAASQSCNRPRALFDELCQAHELDRASRRLLRKLAAQRKLSQPAELFLLPDSFEISGLSASLRARQTELAFLQTKLFESAEPKSAAPRKRGEIEQIARQASHN